MNFYTNVYQAKNKVYIRGIDNGTPYRKVEEFKPYLFLPSKEESQYKTLPGGFVKKKLFANIREAKDFMARYEDVDGFDIYGMANFIYLWIYENFRGEMDYNSSQIKTVCIDIETKMDHDFDVELAMNEVTAITTHCQGEYHIWGIHEYRNSDTNTTYHQCEDERSLLKSFLTHWAGQNYDIVTGWNVEFFDIPYLINRIRRIVGDDATKMLSPWGILHPYELEIKGRSVTSYSLVGMTVLDYMQIYKKFNLEPRESYKLDLIAEVELGENKLDYSEYDGLDDLYEKNYQTYIDYNKRDVLLVCALDDKLKMINQVLSLAYDAKVNYQDALATVKPWDSIIHDFLMDKNIVIPQPKRHQQQQLIGGYVKPPLIGRHKWTMSLDLTSLYPHLIMGWNISPETFVKRINIPTMDQLLAGVKPDNEGYAIAANGCAYRKDIQGFLGDLMEMKFNKRVTLKKQMLEMKKEYEKTKDDSLLPRITQLDNAQTAIKIQINSAYGALANIWFRWFDINHAEAITTTGRLAIQWISIKLNAYLNKIFSTTDVDYVVANDTDSCIVTLNALVEKLMPGETDNFKITRMLNEFGAVKIQPYIDKCYIELDELMNAHKHRLLMKVESVSSVSIWSAAKVYMMYVYSNEGVVYNKPKLKAVGLKAVKASTPAQCRNSLREAFELILSSDEETVQEHISKFKDVFMTLPFDSIAFPRSVTSVTDWQPANMNQFKSGTPINVKGSLLYNHILKMKKLTNKYEMISNGDKIKFCYLKSPNPYQCNVIAAPDKLPPEFDIDRYLDRELQFSKTYLQPISSILDIIGWSAEKRNNLLSFFS